MERHKYGGRIPSLSEYLDDIYRPENAESLVKGISEMLLDENNYDVPNADQIARYKAEEILGLQTQEDYKGDPGQFPPQNPENLNELKAVKKAVEAGYLDEIHLRLPWHPSPFLKGEIETFPYEHDSVILYTVITVDTFFVGGGETPHPRSALKDEYIKPDIDNETFLEDPEDLDFNTWSAHEIGIYMGLPSLMNTYGHLVIENYNTDILLLEIEVPSEKLNMYDLWEDTPIHNLNELKQHFNKDKFDKPPISAFRHSLDKAANAESVNDACGIQFGVRHAIPFEWIRGVWDYKENEEKIFEPLETVLSRLGERYPLQIPGTLSEDQIKQRIEKQIKEDYSFLKDVEEDAKTLKTLLPKIEREIEKNRSEADKTGENLANAIKRYNKCLKQLRDTLKSEMIRGSSEGWGDRIAHNTEYSKLDEPDNIASLEEFGKKYQKIEEYLQKLMEKTEVDIKKEKNLAAQNHWDLRTLKKERNFHQKIDYEIIQIVGSIPRLKL